VRKADRISSIFILAICIFFFIQARDFSPLSGLFPKVIMYILGGLSVLLLLRSFFWKKEGAAFDSGAFRHIPSLVTLALIIAWAALVSIVGFLVTSLIFFPLITVYLDRKAPGKKIAGRIALSVCLTVVFYFFFTKVLYVPFPEGLLL